MSLRIKNITTKTIQNTNKNNCQPTKPNIIPIELPGEFWSVSCYFNPLKYNSRLRNFLLFYHRLSSQCNNILIVELAAHESQLILHKYLRPTSLLQLVTNNNEMLWQKESLLNLGINTLPSSCDKVCWLDCDVLIQDDKWVETTSKLLTRYVVVQPFEVAVRLPKDVVNISTNFATNDKLKGFAKQYLDEVHGKTSAYGHPGYACAFRRIPLVSAGGLFDTCIIGAGDQYIARAIMDTKLTRGYSANHLIYYEQWRNKFQQYIQHSFSYVKHSKLFHLYHGAQSNRQYSTRLQKFAELNYDPNKDLIRQPNGLYKLSPHGQIFTTWLRDFFIKRQEDG